jgi:hypothetical protein
MVPNSPVFVAFLRVSSHALRKRTMTASAYRPARSVPPSEPKRFRSIRASLPHLGTRAWLASNIVTCTPSIGPICAPETRAYSLLAGTSVMLGSILRYPHLSIIQGWSRYGGNRPPPFSVVGLPAAVPTPFDQ